MDNIRVIIVDDHPTVRFGLEAILNKFEDISVVGVAASGDRALSLCRQQEPDVALVDFFMPRMDGIETIRAIHAEFPEINLIMLTHSDRDTTVIEAMNAGATSYLVKDAEVGAIVEAIRAAASGRRTLSPEALEAIIRTRSMLPVPPDNQLTSREHEVLRLMADGMKNPQIAEELFITLSTVKFHVSMIFKKLNVTTRTEAVVKAIETDLIDHS